MTRIANAEELSALRETICRTKAERAAAGHKQIRLCMGAACIASGALRIKEALQQQLTDRHMEDKVDIVETGCLGPCSAGPSLMIGEVFYEKLQPEDAAEIVAEHLAKGRVVERLAHKRPDGRTVSNAADMDFFKRQTKIVLRN